MYTMKTMFLSGFILVCYMPIVCAREIIKDAMQSAFEVRVNGTVFARYIGVVGGVRTEQFLVNNQAVSAEVFEDQLVRAEAEERRVDLRQETEMLGAREREEQVTRIAVTEKLLGQLIDRCKKDLGLLEKFTLERYFAFSTETLTREDYEHVVTELIPAAQKAITGGSDSQKIYQLYRELGSYERRINAFVFATIRQAIDQCSDPKLLKELLAVVS